MKNVFDFSRQANEFIYTISPTINLHITQTTNDCAVLYFTNKMGNKIVPPNGIAVYTYTYSSKLLYRPEKNIVNSETLLGTGGQNYPLYWTNDYTVEMNNVNVITIADQRKWSIMGNVSTNI
jgi:hypothetical protein